LFRGRRKPHLTIILDPPLRRERDSRDPSTFTEQGVNIWCHYPFYRSNEILQLNKEWRREHKKYKQDHPLTFLFNIFRFG